MVVVVVVVVVGGGSAGIVASDMLFCRGTESCDFMTHSSGAV